MIKLALFSEEGNLFSHLRITYYALCRVVFSDFSHNEYGTALPQNY